MHEWPENIGRWVGVLVTVVLLATLLPLQFLSYVLLWPFRWCWRKLRGGWREWWNGRRVVANPREVPFHEWVTHLSATEQQWVQEISDTDASGRAGSDVSWMHGQLPGMAPIETAAGTAARAANNAQFASGMSFSQPSGNSWGLSSGQLFSIGDPMFVGRHNIAGMNQAIIGSRFDADPQPVRVAPPPAIPRVTIDGQELLLNLFETSTNSVGFTTVKIQGLLRVGPQPVAVTEESAASSPSANSTERQPRGIRIRDSRLAADSV
jgi:hypothetical protein